MAYLYLTLAVLGIAAQSITKKASSSRGVGGKFIFSFVSVFATLLFFLVRSGFRFSFTPEYTPYTVAFAITYAGAIVFSFFAIMTGPLSITALINSYSLVLPTVFGMIYYKEQGTPALFIGIVLLTVSLVLVNMSGKSETGKITPIWIFFATASFLSNGICSIAQNMHSRAFGGVGSNEFMTNALIVVTALLFVLVFFGERKIFLKNLRAGWHLMVGCGLANGLSNMLVIMCSVLLNASVMYPIISAGGIIISSLVSIFAYREKLSTPQYIGLFLGIGAVVLCSI